MTALRIWFVGRSLRERRLLLVAAALAVLTLLWGGIVIPVRDSLASAHERYADSVDRLGATIVRVDRLRVAPHGPLPTGDLVEIVRVEAAEAGFALATINPESGTRVRATIQSARPGALAPWLARLEARGVLVDAATLTDNGDRTVGAVLLLKARAA